MLLDTSGLLCFHHKAERRHADAVQLFRAAPLRVTHNYVLAEFIALAQARGLPRKPALDFLTELEANSAVEVVFVDPDLHAAARKLLRRRLDKDWSLCDAVSFFLMGARGLIEALTTDHHFEQAGFVRLLRP